MESAKTTIYRSSNFWVHWNSRFEMEMKLLANIEHWFLQIIPVFAALVDINRWLYVLTNMRNYYFICLFFITQSHVRHTFLWTSRTVLLAGSHVLAHPGAHVLARGAHRLARIFSNTLCAVMKHLPLVPCRSFPNFFLADQWYIYNYPITSRTFPSRRPFICHVSNALQYWEELHLLIIWWGSCCSACSIRICSSPTLCWCQPSQ